MIDDIQRLSGWDSPEADIVLVLMLSLGLKWLVLVFLIWRLPGFSVAAFSLVKRWLEDSR